MQRVIRRRAHGGMRSWMNPSITIWPAMVAVTVEFRPQHKSAMPNRMGARSDPSKGAKSACALSISATSDWPVAWNVEAARIRIDALIVSANMSAIVLSQVASRSASRLDPMSDP